MRAIIRVACCCLLPTICGACWAQDAGRSVVEATLCNLYQHPGEYSGKIVRVRGTITGNDMRIDSFTEKPCPSWMSIVVVFPDKTKPPPDFDLVKDGSFSKFEDSMYHSRPINIEATFEGRFDSIVIVRDGKRVTVGKGYGEKHQHNGRIVLHRVSDVVVRPLGRK